MPTPVVMKNWTVTFDETGEILTCIDVSSPGNPPRPRVLPVRATTMAEAIKAAHHLYSLAK